MNEDVGRWLSELRRLRIEADISIQELSDRLILGPGWVELYETAQAQPSVGLLITWLAEIGVEFRDFAQLLRVADPATALVRLLRATQEADRLTLHFPYGDHDAHYEISAGTLAQFEQVMKTMRDGLAGIHGDDETDLVTLGKSSAVARTFLTAMRCWPEVNPSDIWYFVVPRAFGDPFNHPASEARRDLSQSWKRTGGWALEQVFVEHYRPTLALHGISIEMPQAERKSSLLAGLGLGREVNPDKADILLVADTGRGERCFGVAHVKASFAERRTDDVPLSAALLRGGFVSPLLTMDCKATPSATPTNRGELGATLTALGTDKRSAKRLDIEREGHFGACFSYNANTLPTPLDQDVAARVVVCDFKNPDDAFVSHVREGWTRINAGN